MLTRPVLLVVRSLQCGGLERTALDLVEHLDALHLVLLDSDGPLVPGPRSAGRVHLPGASALETWARGPGPVRAVVRYARYALRLLGLVLLLRPRAVVAGCLEALIAACLLPIPGLPWIAMVGSDNRDVLQREHPGRARVYGALLAAVYRRARFLVVPSHGLAEVLIRHFAVPRRRVRVIPNPVDVERIESLAGPVSEEPVILGVGRFIPVKGFDVLIRAFARAGLPGHRLVLHGEGPERKSLEALGVPVEFAGYTANPWRAMRRAEIVVVPSRVEGFSNVLAEALAAGAAVVVSDCPHGPREIVQDGREARMVPPGDAEALAEALVDLASRPEERDRLRRAAALRARDFDVSSVAPQFGAFLDEVAP